MSNHATPPTPPPLTCEEAVGRRSRNDWAGPLDETAEFWQKRWKEACDRADSAESERDEIGAFANLWKRVSRRLFLERRTMRSYAEMCKGSVERAAEERRAAEDALREANEVVKSLRAMTPRDHLDAAFAGGYRRKGGMIPQGTEFIAFLGHRPGEGVRVSVAPTDLPEIEDRCERRLLDPEPPARPTELQVLAKVSTYMDEAGSPGIDAVTAFLEERGKPAGEDRKGLPEVEGWAR